MAMKYLVRTGFVVLLTVVKADKSTYERAYGEGEELVLEDADAEKHAHKLEYANPKDRAAALAAETAAKQKQLAAQDPAELVKQLVAALAQAQGAVAPAAPATA